MYRKEFMALILRGDGFCMNLTSTLESSRLWRSEMALTVVVMEGGVEADSVAAEVEPWTSSCLRLTTALYSATSISP